MTVAHGVKAGGPFAPGVLFRSLFADRTTGAVLALIAAFTAVRLILMTTVGLGVDETYALATARDWQLSYFDHPPLHYWLAHLGSLLFGETRFARLPFVMLSAGSSWLMFRLTARLFGERAGLWAVLALNLSLYLSVAAGGWILPDGPLDFCLLAAGCHAAALVSGKETSSRSHWRSWLAIGFWIGLGTLSKYHAILFGAGLLGFLAASPQFRGEFRKPALYAGIATALLVLSPVVIWNAEHGWASLLYQGTRAGPNGGGIGRFLSQLGGECFVLFPWIMAALVAAAIAVSGRAGDRARFLLWLGLPAILVFSLVPLWGPKGFPHWTLPGWLMLFPLLGEWLAQRSKMWPRLAAAASITAFAAFLAAADGAANSGWLGANYPRLFAKGDPTLEMMEWRPARNMLAARGYLSRGNLYVLATSWRDAAKLDQALRGALSVRTLSDPHNYAFRRNAGGIIGSDALMLLRPARVASLLSQARPYFSSFETLPPLLFGRNGRGEIELVCVLAHAQRKLLPQPY